MSSLIAPLCYISFPRVSYYHHRYPHRHTGGIMHIYYTFLHWNSAFYLRGSIISGESIMKLLAVCFVCQISPPVHSHSTWERHTPRKVWSGIWGKLAVRRKSKNSRIFLKRLNFTSRICSFLHKNFMWRRKSKIPTFLSTNFHSGLWDPCENPKIREYFLIDKFL